MSNFGIEEIKQNRQKKSGLKTTTDKGAETASLSALPKNKIKLVRKVHVSVTIITRVRGNHPAAPTPQRAVDVR